MPGCQITTYYYVGFVYMMMRRYNDAIRTFSNILINIQRTKSTFQNKAQLYDQVNLVRQWKLQLVFLLNPTITLRLAWHVTCNDSVFQWWTSVN